VIPPAGPVLDRPSVPSSVDEVVGFDVGDGGVVRLSHWLQQVPAEDRGGGAADASVASVGVVPGPGEGAGDHLVDLLGQVPLCDCEAGWCVVVDDPRQDTYVVVVQ